MSGETDIRPFRVDMPGEAIADLRQRINAACWPSEELVADRSQGVQLATIQELARYWASAYDWRRCDQGAGVTDAMGRQAPGGLAGIHLNFLRDALAGAGSPGGQAPGRIHHVPRRDLPGPARLGRAGLPQPHLLPRGGPGRPGPVRPGQPRQRSVPHSGPSTTFYHHDQHWPKAGIQWMWQPTYSFP